INKPGVGLNNFTVTMEKYGYVTATTRFLQPVHNIYLLILSETGLIGLAGFIYLLYKGRSLFIDKVQPCHLALLILLFLGLFDHYFFTLQQGLLLLTILLACNKLPDKL
ncbi:O-antigen ligase family protein, partial [Microgenomates group bacterium]|nr:O-antigen ligase family protein [Microgenomates group bacterium]